MAFPAIAAGIGLAIQGGGAIASGNAQRDAAERDSYNKRLQALEVERTEAVKTQLMRQTGDRLQGEQVSAYAKGGVELSGSPLLNLEATKAGVEGEIAEMQRDAAFRASQLRTGADSSVMFGNDRATAGYIGAAGGILTGIGKIPGLFDGNDGAVQKLSSFQTPVEV
jgi:hypothetical protein